MEFIRLASKSFNCINKVVRVVDFDRAEFPSVPIWVWKAVRALPWQNEVDIFTETTSIVGFTVVVWHIWNKKFVHLENRNKFKKPEILMLSERSHWWHVAHRCSWPPMCMGSSLRELHHVINPPQHPHRPSLREARTRETTAQFTPWCSELLPLLKFGIQSQSFGLGLFQPV